MARALMRLVLLGLLCRGACLRSAGPLRLRSSGQPRRSPLGRGGRRGAAMMILGVEAFAAELPKYAFMLPTATCVATTCQLCGIGGAALFSPIFLLVFPALGADYPLASPAAAVATALCTEAFGFASGLTGYARRGLVAWDVARDVALVSVPVALVGAACAPALAGDARALRAAYALLMIGLAWRLVAAAPPDAKGCVYGGSREVVDADGRAYSFDAPTRDARSLSATAAGGFLTGLLGVGAGEVVLPELTKDCGMPIPLAAGTSVAVVCATAAAAAVCQFAQLSAEATGGVVAVVPWDLVVFTVPGVVLGGQIAPRLAGAVDDVLIERGAAALFGLVGVAFAWAAATGGG